ncbi:SCY1 protein kinase Ppk32 [Schizosaccharomyces cryophilus OY26]|uniref:SCY1 protein kinase Ppk32 n=1 Tax=Schizosaccharomyces cryophilus (strain OY26 / ATCC MYA-4695 / CBS 11777 / NBRC 106824 / NRRL Y48691) TaxID=653667 RepID=S9W6G3_SCHCR|nr:SCY1 protein kinase Ppk32 [Schizosaccharomyces cryophilus OY26]EPY54134.1 SCY1 protein kinase Ppk32 [Schizosaccharomyces cryophilus OY26]
MFANAIRLVSNSKKIKNEYNIDKESPIYVGPWTVYPAAKRGTDVEVSVFSFEKRNLSTFLKNSSSLNASLKENMILENLRRDVGSLSRLRHPSLLQVVEPLEESKSRLTFVTKRVQFSLADVICVSTPITSDSSDPSNPFALDEIEIQKGLLQIMNGLSFLKNSAKILHLNVQPRSVIIDSKGDWKLCGFGFCQSLECPRYELLDFDFSIPSSLQQCLDFLAPEYVLHEIVGPENDVFSLGCLIYAVFNRGKSVINAKNHLLSYEKEVSDLNDRLGFYMKNIHSHSLRSLLLQLLSLNSKDRIDVSFLESADYFTSGTISTLRFLEAFPEKLQSEKAAFLESLVNNLSAISYRVQSQKVLPTLLDFLNDQEITASLLPCIFQISKSLDSSMFSSKVFPKFLPLLSHPQNSENTVIIILQSIDCFKVKLPRSTFYERVLPFVYACLEQSSTSIQISAVKIFNYVLDILDQKTVKSVICPKLYHCFAVTKQLEVKVAILECFHVFINATLLDSFAILDKLLPLLEKVKTRVSAVVIAMLQVYADIGRVIPEESVHELVMPRLWVLSASTELTVQEYTHFMREIRKLGDFIQREHIKKLHSHLSSSPYESSKHSTKTSSNAIANSQSSYQEQSPFIRASSSLTTVPSFASHAPSASKADKSSTSTLPFPPLLPTKINESGTHQNQVKNDESLNDLGAWKSLL